MVLVAVMLAAEIEAYTSSPASALPPNAAVQDGLDFDGKADEELFCLGREIISHSQVF